MTDFITDHQPDLLPASVDPATGRGIHQLGYRAWSGWKTSEWFRWKVIAEVGIRRSWQNKWLKRMLLLAWMPAFWFGVGFFLWEQAALYPEWRHLLRPILRNLPATPQFEPISRLMDDSDFQSNRHLIWAWLLNSFIRYPQPVLMVLLVGMIAPPLISQDIRSRAFLLYFSRPVTRLEYLFGKLATLWAYLAMISVLPALSIYVFGVLFSPSFSVVLSTWDIPLRIMIASLFLIIPTSSLALCFSSLTQESRNAGFAWFAVWVLGWFTYGAVSSAEAFNAEREFDRQGTLVSVPESPWTHLSLYHTLGKVQNWVFGFSEWTDVWISFLILTIVTAVSLTVLFRRISAPMRV